MGSLLSLWDHISSYGIDFWPMPKIKVQSTEQMCDRLSAHGIASRPIDQRKWLLLTFILITRIWLIRLLYNYYVLFNKIFLKITRNGTTHALVYYWQKIYVGNRGGTSQLTLKPKAVLTLLRKCVIATRPLGLLLGLLNSFSDYENASQLITEIKVLGSFDLTKQMCYRISAFGIAFWPIELLLAL
ncbi:hypothetical protein M0802_015976 [Mischocyttarus mexicanus]|nr:hypothetical protein M0802_015976 [Mischocyttarus mexicanus]